MITCRYRPERRLPLRVEQGWTEDLPSDYLRLCLLTDGYAVLQIDGERCYLTAGVLVCVRPGETLRWLCQRQARCLVIAFAPEFINVHLSGERLFSPDYPALAQRFQFPSLALFRRRSILYKGLLPLTPESCGTLRRLFEALRQEVTVQTDERWSCRARTMLFDILQLADLLREDLEREAEPAASGLGFAVMDYIQMHLGEAVSVTGLCRRFHTNHTTLGREFREAAGMGVGDYLKLRRIQQARSALAFTGLTVEEIAERYGFCDGSHFGKVFKSLEGVTPLQYRKAMRGLRDETARTSGDAAEPAGKAQVRENVPRPGPRDIRPRR